MLAAMAGERFPDCGSCDGELGCFKKSETLTVSGPGLPTITVRRGDWLRIVDTVRRQEGFYEHEPEINCLEFYSVCPRSILDDFTFAIYELYYALGGLSRLSDPESYYRLPDIYVQAVHIIDGVQTKIQRARLKQLTGGN